MVRRDAPTGSTEAADCDDRQVDRPHPLAEAIRRASIGNFPPADGGFEVLPPVRDGEHTVVAFTGHALITTAASPSAVLERHPDGFGGATAPAFLMWLAGEEATIGSLDVLLCASGRGSSTLTERHDLDDHPRVRHARRLRDDVKVYGDACGLVTLGRGLGGLPEISVEVDPQLRNRRIGRTLIGTVSAWLKRENSSSPKLPPATRSRCARSSPWASRCSARQW
jgi:GNAT superfamily N-acetyltransferase